MSEEKHILVWNDCLKIFENILDHQQYATWFKPIKPVSLVDSDLTVEVPSHFFCEFIEATYLDLLRSALRRVIGADARLFYQVSVVENEKPVRFPLTSGTTPTNSAISVPTVTPAENPGPMVFPGIQRVQIDPHLKSEYCFDNMVQGACNKMGIVAGKNIADAPGKTSLNPLFIFGGPGLGKTHLANAIGLRIKQLFPELVVLYIPANTFKTQYMVAVSAQNKMTDFLAFYQKIDVLIIDDIQELYSPGAQGAFFHIFNHLHQNNKQLIFTSDRPQVELQNFEQRLLSRLKWGLSIQLTTPDYFTRLEMLRSRVAREGVDVDDEVLQFLASRIKTNFRELEGSLMSVIANATFGHEKIDVALAQRVTDMLVDDATTELSIDNVEKAVCQYFNITAEEIHSPSRKRQLVQARQIAMYLARSLTSSSLSTIGDQIGGRDHATVLHACTTVADLMSTDRVFKQYVNDIQRILTIG